MSLTAPLASSSPRCCFTSPPLFRPLYLFDCKFGEKCPDLAADYTVPGYFSEDLFHVLDDRRPDYRWLIVGAARSGSTFHIDPNQTSAWNATIVGSKKWVLFPPEVVPPGVHPSPDGAMVATPVAITEWFQNFYKSSRGLRVRVCCLRCRRVRAVVVVVDERE